MKKPIAGIVIITLLLCLFCCEASADKYPEKVEGIDFGGAEVQILDFWSGNGGRVNNPTEKQQALYDYQDWINETYNVHVVQKMGGDWGTCAEEMMKFTNNPDGSYRIYIIEPNKVGHLISGGYASAINTSLINPTSDQWNSAETEFLTIGGRLHGMVKGKSEPRGVLFFNKRVLNEAGIDWNTIYDLQAAGKWTWSAFENILEKITRDTDHDGEIDIWGLIGSSDELLVCSVFSNGGSFFDFDENGRIHPTMTSNQTIEALTWAVKIRDKHWAPTPQNANWDWYKEGWKQGYCGFYINQAYSGFYSNSEMYDMTDEWGCVAFPVHNSGDTYVTVVNDNVALIPSCYDSATVAKLAFIYDLWTNPAPGYDEDNDWIGEKYNYTDERAVDETYAMLREPEHCKVNNVAYLGTQNDILGIPLLWGLQGDNLEDLIEAGMPEWEARCEQINSILDNMMPDLSGMAVLTLPSSLTKIESEAFSGIQSEAIIIPASCIECAQDAFADCNNLKYIINYSTLEIIVPETVRIINLHK